jgi:hypothetical protein
MKAEELRVGNYVYGNKYNSVYKIVMFLGLHDCTIINSIGYDEHDKELSNIKPIPLTEEWLFKFGFEKGWCCDNYDRYESDDFEMLKDYGEQGVAIAKNKHSYNHVYCGYYENEIECNYVHQLQNLYYALTQKELNYEG